MLSRLLKSFEGEKHSELNPAKSQEHCMHLSVSLILSADCTKTGAED